MRILQADEKVAHHEIQDASTWPTTVRGWVHSGSCSDDGPRDQARQRHAGRPLRQQLRQLQCDGIQRDDRGVHYNFRAPREWWTEWPFRLGLWAERQSLRQQLLQQLQCAGIQRDNRGTHGVFRVPRERWTELSDRSNLRAE